MTERREIIALEGLLKANSLIAEEIRKEFSEKGKLLVNILSSPGAGKTTLLQNLVPMLGNVSVGVLVGDVATDRDRRRLESSGVDAVQITTGGPCHLEAHMIKQAFFDSPLRNKDILFIENVGNLVCPASYDLGEHIRVVLTSTPEGEDKPRKYPKAFITSQVLVISKSDLIRILSYDLEKVIEDARSLNPQIKTFVTSAKTGEGLKELASFFLKKKNELKKDKTIV